MNSELFKTTASTVQKIANLPRHRHPGDLINNYVRPIRQQRLQIDGKLQFGAKLYSSQAQQRLVKQLIQTRASFRNVSIQQRHKLAGNQFNIWSQYLQDQVTKIPESQHLIGDKKQKIYESYLIAKQRNQQKIQLARTVKLFYQISLGFKFDIPLHPLVMIRMVNPHYGYLNNYKDQRLTFDQYIKFLQEMVAVSRLFSEGSTLHGSQLLSFVFWKAYTSKATLSTQQFSKFLTLFKFNTKPQNITKDFEYHLTNRKGQIKDGSPIRFDLWRNIFLERGL